ncbi:transposase [Brevinema andersonii]|uniref:transposase n=1 Tax=Brevinema andersonii TaxID=34097 RepID=UPI00190EFD93
MILIIVSNQTSLNILNQDLRFFRQIINHKFEFPKNNIHTNSIESFWAILKRGISSIYHHISLKYP